MDGRYAARRGIMQQGPADDALWISQFIGRSCHLDRPPSMGVGVAPRHYPTRPARAHSWYLPPWLPLYMLKAYPDLSWSQKLLCLDNRYYIRLRDFSHVAWICARINPI
jgi:hypothetical protein